MVTINVYQRHIDRGFGGKGCELICPLAIALTEQLGVRIGVWAGRAWEVYTGDYYELPEIAVKRYIRYDRGALMQPFSFELGDKVKYKAPTEKNTAG